MKTITTEITIAATPDLVWEVLTDFERHADWNPFFASIAGTAKVGERLVVTSRKDDGGPGMKFRPVVLEADGRTLRWLGKLAFGGIFDGTHYFLLEEAEGGTRMVHGEDFRGLLVPLMGKVTTEAEEGFQAFNTALAERVGVVRDTRLQGCGM